MDYMELLQKIRDNAQQAAEAKRRLMAASQSSAETDEWKRRYMRCQGEFERDRETAREIIRSAKDPIIGITRRIAFLDVSSATNAVRCTAVRCGIPEQNTGQQCGNAITSI